MAMSREEIVEVLRAHAAWLQGKKDGHRANLCGANFRGANLCGADLCGANLCETGILGITGSRHGIVAMSTEQVQIGCHIKTLGEWCECYAAIGRAEGYTPEQIAEYS